MPICINRKLIRKNGLFIDFGVDITGFERSKKNENKDNRTW